MQVRIEWGGRVSLPGREGKVWKAWGKAGGHREEKDHWHIESGEHETERHGKVGVQPSTTGKGTRPYSNSEF